MPLYVYQVIDPEVAKGKFSRCSTIMSDPPLTQHPETGQPVRRLLGMPIAMGRCVMARQHQLSTPRPPGFHQHRRNGKGTYEKTAWPGAADHHQGKVTRTHCRRQVFDLLRRLWGDKDINLKSDFVEVTFATCFASLSRQVFNLPFVCSLLLHIFQRAAISQRSRRYHHGHLGLQHEPKMAYAWNRGTAEHMPGLRSEHPLRRSVADPTEQTFMANLGVADPELVDYLSILLSRFVHLDAIHRFRNAAGQRIEDVVEMILEASVMPLDGRTPASITGTSATSPSFGQAYILKP